MRIRYSRYWDCATTTTVLVAERLIRGSFGGRLCTKSALQRSVGVYARTATAGLAIAYATSPVHRDHHHPSSRLYRARETCYSYGDSRDTTHEMA